MGDRAYETETQAVEIDYGDGVAFGAALLWCPAWWDADEITAIRSTNCSVEFGVRLDSLYLALAKHAHSSRRI